MDEKRSTPSTTKIEPGLPAIPLMPGGPGSTFRTPPVSLRTRIWRGRWMLLAVLAGFTLFALMLSAIQPPLYKTQTSIELQSPADDTAHKGAPGQPSSAESYIQTQIRIIQSRSLLERVLAKLDEAERTRIAQAPHLSWKRPSEDQRIASILQRTSASASSQAGIIDICFLSPDPVAGAHFLNVLTDELADYNVERTWHAAQRNRQWTERQLDELRRKWEQSESALAEFSEAAASPANKPAPNKPARTVSSFAAENADPKLRQLKKHLTDLNLQIEKWRSLYGPTAPALSPLKAAAAATDISIRQRRAALHLNASAVAQNVTGSATTPDASSHLAAPATDAQKAAHLNALREDAESNRQIFEAAAARFREASVSNASRIADINVVDPAIPVSKPITPKPVRNALLGALAGLLCGLSFVGLRDRFSNTFTDAGLLSQHLGIDVLGTIPSDRSASLPKNTSALTADPSLHLSFDADARTAEAYRALRSSLLLRAAPGAGPRRLVFTGPNGSEGKTSVVGNLGAALASAHRRVLLVDGDMRSPGLHKLFGASNQHGLSDLLAHQLTAAPIKMSDIIRQTQIPGLYLLSSGQAGDRAPEILSSDELPQLMLQFSKGFDIVLIDAPPVLPYSDVRSLARAADAAILVIRANSTDRRSALLARDSIAADGSAIAGAILTDCDNL